MINKLIFLAASVIGVFGQTLAWDALPSDQKVTNYTVYVVQGTNDVKSSTGTNTLFSLSHLNDGKRYELYVTASNSHGESAPSQSVFYTSEGVPKSPTIVKASWHRQFTGRQGLWLVELSWLPVSGVSAYQVVTEQFSLNNPTDPALYITNSTVQTNWSRGINFGRYNIYVQSISNTGTSGRDTVVYSPSVPVWSRDPIIIPP